jgi:hypothetical protein
VQKIADATFTSPSHVPAYRERELADKLTDALAHCERLAFVVEGDMRAEQA